MAKKQAEYENEKIQKKEENLKKVEEEKKQAQKVQAALGYDYSVEDTDPEEDLDDTPLWLRGRDTIEDELEDALIKKLLSKCIPSSADRREERRVSLPRR